MHTCEGCGFTGPAGPDDDYLADGWRLRAEGDEVTLCDECTDIAEHAAAGAR